MYFSLSPQARRELTRQYKQAFPPMGVYAVRCDAAGLLRLGSSRNAEGSPIRLRFELGRGAHRDRALQQAWNTHGADAFRLEVIDRVKLIGLNPMFVGENLLIEYGMQYQPRRKAFEIRRNGEPWLSYEPDGDPIPPHTYLSFAKQVTQRWMHSPAHRENMLSKHPRFLGSAVRAGTTEDEIRFGIAGNPCRCTGYQNIVKAIQYAAAKLRGETFAEAAE